MLVLWAQDGPLNGWYDPLAIWRTWVPDVQGGAIASGHFLPAEAPAAPDARLAAFFKE